MVEIHHILMVNCIKDNIVSKNIGMEKNVVKYEMKYEFFWFLFETLLSSFLIIKFN